jgi:phenylalanyl-tRNA synthetase beta chain
MNTSVRWINDYLAPHATAEEQADCLTRAGFPMESREEVRLPSGERDVRQDIELTSNRGDCLCHVGLAREIAAISGRTLKAPTPQINATGPAASSLIAVENREKDRCPLYTARIIRGVKVGPSPAWLQERLLARGDIPRNNIVDASNFVLFELGQPTHVFDLAKIRGGRIIIRNATANEPFLPIGEGATALKLHSTDLVIADAERAVGIAGVKGGAETAVSGATRDILIEAASFAPAAARSSSRRHGIASDAAYRFERGVSPAAVNHAADRLVELILQICGGELCAGVVSDGKTLPALREITMRCDRCRAVIGLPIDDDGMRTMLERLSLQPRLQGGRIHCTIPAERLDLEREIDLIEEVARLNGLEKLDVAGTIPVRIAAPQPSELARRAVNDALVGMGFIETVTHSLVSEQAANLFLPPDMTALKIEDERAGAEPVLRPSILPSLLRVYAHNRDNGVHDVRLFETASVFAVHRDQHIERVNLAMLAPAMDGGPRELRGVIDRLTQIIFGKHASVTAEPMTAMPWFSAAAVLKLGADVLGTCGVLSPATIKAFGLIDVLVAAEIGLPQHYSKYPPSMEAKALPAFPSIERDISAILEDRKPWSAIEQAVGELKLQHLDAVEFVTTFRGKQAGAGRKSLTLRLRFRAADRTLKHEEVDGQMTKTMDMLRTQFAAEIRS